MTLYGTVWRSLRRICPLMRSLEGLNLSLEVKLMTSNVNGVHSLPQQLCIVVIKFLL